MRRLLLVCAIILVAQMGTAVVPETMSYQGVLMDAGGTILPDGSYDMTFRIYTTPVAGVPLWAETQVVPVQDGVFDAILGSVVPLAIPFDTTYWLGTQVGAAAELAPRTELASAPYAHRARFADVGAPDDDWAIAGDDIYHIEGSVGIGAIPPPSEAAEKEGAPAVQGRGAYKLFTASTDQIAGYFYEGETVDDPDDRLGAVMGYRNSGSGNPGTSPDPDNSNFGVMGYNLWGDEYTYGVHGTTWFDNPHTAAILGYEKYSGLWAALAYRDEDINDWGLYTPGRAYLGDGLRLPTGAVNGYVLTSDALGYASWEPGGGGGGIGGGGTANYMTKFTGPTTVGNSIMYDTGSRIGIGTTSPGSRVVIEEATTGQALEVLTTYSGTLAARTVNFERTNDPGGANDLLQIKTPSTAPDDFQFIECERGSAGVEFAVDGDGRLTANGGAEINGDVVVTGNSGFTGYVSVTGQVTADASGNYGGRFATSSTSTSASAVYGEMTQTGNAVDADGVRGYSKPVDGYGYGGYFEGGYRGVNGIASGAFSGIAGVRGEASSSSGTSYGVYGRANGTGLNCGVYGTASGGTASYGLYSQGNAHVNGTLSKSAGSFKIDHPLNPETMYLSHSFVESPDMMNVYNGNVVLGASGEATVDLPDWFETLNRDFRYQLTAIGAPGPNLYVAEEVSGNQFRIAGGEAGMKVSWQVTGVRQDKYAEEHRIQVEEYKSAEDAGKYMHADLYGAPDTQAIGYVEERPRETGKAPAPNVELPQLEERDRAEDSE